MSLVTMTVQEALNKKKILEKRWAEEMNDEKAYITYATSTQKVVDGVEREEVENILKSQFDSKVHLLKNLSALKIAINKSNASTIVNISGKEYTVADAIARMNFMDNERKFYNRAMRQYNTCKNNVDATNKKVLDPDNIAAYLSRINGDQTKVRPEVIEALKESYKEENMLHIIDPNNINDVVSKMIDDLDQFEAEVHTKLTTSNINTEIEVEFED